MARELQVHWTSSDSATKPGQFAIIPYNIHSGLGRKIRHQLEMFDYFGQDRGKLTS